jgi:hypothetical protein
VIVRRLLPLVALVALCALPAQAHSWMTKRKAEKYVKDVIRSDFGSGDVLAWGASSRCRLVGTELGGYKVFRCAFRVRFGAFRYRGSARVYPFRPPGNPETLYRLAYRWHRGSCGAFPAGSPQPGPFPYAIRTRNLKCPTARRWIWNWYVRGRPMPSAYDCLLRSTPATARCEAGRRAFSFRYPD